MHLGPKVTLMDKWVGVLLDKLRDLGIWDETAIIFTTDHGFYHGEHNRIGKHTVLDRKHGWPLYEEINHVPLMVKIPGIKSGWRCNALVQPTDIMATLLDIGGASVPENLHGQSILQIVFMQEKMKTIK